MFDRIKRFYDRGLWTKEMVYDAHIAGAITEEQYREIVGDLQESYEEVIIESEQIEEKGA